MKTLTVSIVFVALLFAFLPAVQAAPPGPEIDQEQSTWQAGILFGRWDGQWDGTTAIAQTFTPATPKKLCQVTVNLFDTHGFSTPAPSAFVELWTDGGGVPGELLASADNSVSADTTTSYLEDFTFLFGDGPRLRKGAQYWLVLRTNADNATSPFAAGWQYDATDPYAGGQLWRLTHGTWTEQNYGQEYGDLYFKEYVCNK